MENRPVMLPVAAQHGAPGAERPEPRPLPGGHRNEGTGRVAPAARSSRLVSRPYRRQAFWG